MNPLLSVDPKRVTIINKQVHTAKYDFAVQDAITYYLLLCQRDAEERTGKPSSQHLIPRFLLLNFEGELGGRANRLQVVRYTMTSDNKITIKQMPDSTSKGFSKRPDFYTIKHYDSRYDSARKFDKYRIEKLLSVIEGNAAPLLKLRQQRKFYRSETFNNPYDYPTSIPLEGHKDDISSSILSTPTGQRIALAVFFAAQYLRSQLMLKTVSSNNKITFNYTDDSIEPELFEGTFPYFIEYMLPDMATLFYGRAWRWVYSRHDNIMPGGTCMLPFYQPLGEYNLGTENGLIMPLGRNSTIYFLEQDTFCLGHDAVFSTNSLSASAWTTYQLLRALAFDMTPLSPTATASRAAEICMHPTTNLEHMFRTGKTIDPQSQQRVLIIQDKQALEKDAFFLGQVPRE